MQPKKSLGQNFLTSEGALLNMIKASKVQKGDRVLEIGPGKGAPTQKLLEAGALVTAVEKDGELVEYLKNLFEKEIKKGQLELIEGDVLEMGKIIKTPYKLIANIPYYITGQIFRMFLESDAQPTSMTVLVQKEVAERVVARDKKESILSISVKAYGVPSYICTVKAGSFNPKPNVDSAILHIEGISKKLFTKISEKNFFQILKAGFAHKRKILTSNLKSAGLDVPEKYKESKVRAEDITTEDWFNLYN